MRRFNEEFDEDDLAPSFKERIRQRKIQKRLERLEQLEAEEDDDAYEEIVSFAEQRRRRRHQKRMEQLESGKEPSLLQFIAMRAMELLIPEIAVSVIMSILITTGVIPSVFIVGLVLMGVSLAGYIIYAGVTSQHMFWAIRDVKRYLLINLCGYGVVVAASVIFRLAGIEIFSWLFLPTKLLTLFGYSAWQSLWVSHGVIIAVMLAILINIKLDRLHELDDIDEDEM